MLKTDSTFYRLILIINMIITAGALVAAIFILATPGDASKLLMGADVCSIIAIFAALYYIFMGYQKHASGYFKLFVFSFSATALLTAAGDLIGGTVSPAPMVICVTFAFIFSFVLGISKNFGKASTLITCTVITVIAIVGLFFTYGSFGDKITSGDAAAVAALIRSAIKSEAKRS